MGQRNPRRRDDAGAGDHLFLVTANRGTETAVLEELRDDLGLDTREVPGGVLVQGSLADGMRAALWSRCGMRVLLHIGSDDIRNERQLYASVRNLPLFEWFTPDHTLAVFARTRGMVFRNSRYVALKTKDAIVDAMRDKFGRRPSVAPRDPDIAVTVHIADTRARYYLDMSGGPLNQRGYRVRDVDAPAKETLAAALLRYSGWDRKSPLMDPFCGSGTFAIEAALWATDTAPGSLHDLGFTRWPGYERAMKEPWEELLEEASQRQRPEHRGVIIATDNDRRAVEATRVNAAQVGLISSLDISERDATNIEPLLGMGTYMMNPPWGERLSHDELVPLYQRVTERLRGHAGHRMGVLSTADLLRDGIPIEAERCGDVLNGKLRCRFCMYSLDE